MTFRKQLLRQIAARTYPSIYALGQSEHVREEPAILQDISRIGGLPNGKPHPHGSGSSGPYSV